MASLSSPAVVLFLFAAALAACAPAAADDDLSGDDQSSAASAAAPATARSTVELSLSFGVARGCPVGVGNARVTLRSRDEARPYAVTGRAAPDGKVAFHGVARDTVAYVFEIVHDRVTYTSERFAPEASGPVTRHALVLAEANDELALRDADAKVGFSQTCRPEPSCDARCADDCAGSLACTSTCRARCPQTAAP